MLPHTQRKHTHTHTHNTQHTHNTHTTLVGDIYIYEVALLNWKLSQEPNNISSLTLSVEYRIHSCYSCSDILKFENIFQDWNSRIDRIDILGRLKSVIIYIERSFIQFLLK
jgi:hypothetical protein